MQVSGRSFATDVLVASSALDARLAVNSAGSPLIRALRASGWTALEYRYASESGVSNAAAGTLLPPLRGRSRETAAGSP